MNNIVLTIVCIFCQRILTGFCLESYQCGPSLLCRCVEKDVHKIHMDCEARQIHTISDVCSSIKNSTFKIISLKIGRNNIGDLMNTDFEGCKSLMELDLTFNQISYIEEETFHKLEHLRVLYLTFNNFGAYRHDWNATVLPPSLHELYLSSTIEVYDLTYPNISHLHNLIKLEMSGLRGSDLPAFFTTMQISNISMSGINLFRTCNLENVTDNTFASIISVKTLNISGCRIQTISANAFKHLTGLEVLDLSFNRYLGFDSMENLTYSLQFTNIRYLNVSHLYNTFGLGVQMYMHDFCYLWNTTLYEIDLSGNRIEEFETNAVILTPTSLNNIFIDYNKFTFGPYLLQVGCLVNLVTFSGKYLNFAYDPFEFIPQMGSYRRRQVRTIPSTHCPHLTEETLRKLANRTGCYYIPDNFTTLSMSLIQMPTTLNNLIFHDCNYIYDLNIQFAFHPAENTIHYLDFSGNVFKTITGTFSGLNVIYTLNFSRCYISFIGQHSLNYSSLRVLRLGKNDLGDQLSSVEKASIFNYLRALEFLDLSANGLTVLLTSTFSPLASLLKLDVSQNNIETFDIMISSLTHILHINLSVNSISTLPIAVVQQLESNAANLSESFTIDLNNNSIAYICNNKEFLDWINDHRTNMIGFPNYRFRTSNGSYLNSQAFINDISNMDSRCRSYTLVIVMSVLSVSVLLAVIIGGIVYRNRWKIRYFMFLSKKHFFGYRRLPDDTLLENYKYDAFISFADEDIKFIVNEIIPRLETNYVSLCIHQRDFLPGDAISDNIIRAIQGSRKTVVILSEAFLRSTWCMYEFNMARMESLYSRDDQVFLVIVMLEHVPHNKMPLEMLRWIQENSYIEYTHDEEGQRMFWERLKLLIQ